MKEIGGYIELDTYHLPMLHKGAIALNCGRNALAYLFRARKIKRLWVPRLICESVTGICDREGVPYSFYSVGADFRPAQSITLGEGDWLYFVNYYSRFGNAQIEEYLRQYGRVIVDNAQSYFQEPLPGVDTLYTCRKYFGVADGAFLYTDAKLDENFPVDESFERMHFLLGRYERTASEFYFESVANNELFATEPIKKMSKLTWNLLHGIDYGQVKTAREENFRYLHEALRGLNKLQIKDRQGTFMYPLMIENGAEVRKKLQAERIYIPMLWPDVLDWCAKDEMEYQMAKTTLPIPIDQRYGVADMEYMVEKVMKCIG